jgi:hypothetical protein
MRSGLQPVPVQKRAKILVDALGGGGRARRVLGADRDKDAVGGPNNAVFLSQKLVQAVFDSLARLLNIVRGHAGRQHELQVKEERGCLVLRRDGVVFEALMTIGTMVTAFSHGDEPLRGICDKSDHCANALTFCESAQMDFL